MGIDSVQAELREAKGKEYSEGQGAIPLSPKRSANPITNLTVIVGAIYFDADAACQRVFGLGRNCKYGAGPVTKKTLVGGDPRLGHPLWIGVRDTQGRIGHGEIAGERPDDRRIGLREFAQNDLFIL